MKPRENDVRLLNYLAQHCKSPDQSGGISIDRCWFGSETARTDHGKAIASICSINSEQLEALVSRLEQYGFVGNFRTSGSIHGWITAAGEDAVDSLSHSSSDGTEGSQRMAVEQASVIDKSNVFVVHGRNYAVRDAFFTFLRAISLHPLEWSEIVQMTGKGSPYIGEILEMGFSVAQAVVVLMTPDDEARLREQFRGHNESQFETELTPQPRPNVLLEAGMALGLCPERTVIVEFGSLRPVTDLGGRHVIRMNNSSERRNDLAQRLQAAGCSVNLVGADWLRTTDFTIEALGLTAKSVERTLDQPAVTNVLNFVDGLSPGELYRIAGALLKNTQTIETGRSDSVAASLLHKGFLERIPFEPTYKLAEAPYLFPVTVWQVLCSQKEWLIERAISTNADRPDRVEQLQKQRIT